MLFLRRLAAITPAAFPNRDGTYSARLEVESPYVRHAAKTGPRWPLSGIPQPSNIGCARPISPDLVGI
jgi:hypothetical protein